MEQEQEQEQEQGQEQEQEQNVNVDKVAKFLKSKKGKREGGWTKLLHHVVHGRKHTVKKDSIVELVQSIVNNKVHMTEKQRKRYLLALCNSFPALKQRSEKSLDTLSSEKLHALLMEEWHNISGAADEGSLSGGGMDLWKRSILEKEAEGQVRLVSERRRFNVVLQQGGAYARGII